MESVKQCGFLMSVVDNKYFVLLCKYRESKNSKFSLDWSYSVNLTDKVNLISIIKSSAPGTFINVGVDQRGKLNGITASLDRFEPKMDAKKNEIPNTRPMVVISQIVNDATDAVIGYKVASANGEVKNVPIKEIRSYGDRCVKDGRIPFQNAIYTPATVGEDGKLKNGFVKSYPDMPFIVEKFYTGKNKFAVKDIVAVPEEREVKKRIDEFSVEQAKQLKLGKEHGINYRVYANPKLTVEQMKVLRGGLEDEIDVRPFASPKYSAECMMSYICDLGEGLDISRYLSPEYNMYQLAQLSLAEELNLNIESICDPKISASEMSEKVVRLKNETWNSVKVN